jgi:hypothetical protein
MAWEEFGRIRILSQGTPAQIIPTPIASPRLKFTALNYALEQTGLIKFGWVRLLDLEGATITTKQISAGAEIITPPDWAGLMRVQFSPVRWLGNAELIISKFVPPPSYDNPEIPVVICLDSLPITDATGGYQ